MSEWKWRVVKPGPYSPPGVVEVHEMKWPDGRLSGWYVRKYDDGTFWVVRRHPERTQVHKFDNLEDAKAFAETMRELKPMYI